MNNTLINVKESVKTTEYSDPTKFLKFKYFDIDPKSKVIVTETVKTLQYKKFIYKTSDKFFKFNKFNTESRLVSKSKKTITLKFIKD